MTISVKHVNQLKSAFFYAVEAGTPEKIFSDEIKSLLPKDKELKILSLGKAASSMAEKMANMNISQTGIVVTNDENFRPIENFTCFATGHPFPDKRGLNAAKKVELFLEELSDKDHLILLLSGGGSSLLPAPPEGITLKEKTYINKVLLESGLDITEVNAVRRVFSRLKGGRLAQKAYPTGITQFVFSDVLDDSLETIASGVAAPDPYEFSEVQKILTKTKLNNIKFVSDFIAKVGKNKNLLPLKKDNKVFEKIKTYLLANNETCVNAAKIFFENENYFVNSFCQKLQGEASLIGSQLADSIIKTINKDKSLSIFGGETTVTVKNSYGKGGRSQELALSFAISMNKNYNKKKPWAILSAGTDGRDGPTDAAGAIITSNSKINIPDAIKSLHKNDSYNFLNKNKLLFKTGGTNTNLGDLVFILN